jgi:hypothetical protein
MALPPGAIRSAVTRDKVARCSGRVKRVSSVVFRTPNHEKCRVRNNLRDSDLPHHKGKGQLLLGIAD